MESKLSRRIFLGTGASVFATAGVGGMPAIVTAAASTASVSASATGVTTILQKLGAGGGFPFQGILHLFHGFNVSPDGVEAIQQRILGVGEWSKYDKDDGNHRSACRHGKIKVEGDGVLNTLSDLPQNIPILDLFGKDMIASVSGNPKFKPEQMDVVLRVLRPICDESTTAADLTQSYLGYFTKLARHAIQSPDDFHYDVGGGRDLGILTQGPEFKNIHRILEKFSDNNDEIKLLNDKLMQTIKSTNQRHYFEELSNRKQRESERLRVEQEKIDDDFRKKQECINNPDARDKHAVTLISMGENNQYKVDYYKHPDIERPDTLPTWVDWYHLAQKLSPDSAKPSDVNVSGLGMIVTFNSKAMIDFIANQEKDNGNDTVVELPNRRSGVDLNNPRDFKPN